ncbi:MAG: bifunctional DNA primase/polymerase [bacterium]
MDTVGGTTKDQALFYARQGLPVFPITPNQKDPPIVQDWPNKATTDPATIRKWWEVYETGAPLNIGIATGQKAGLLVLDIDGEQGQQTYEQLPAPKPPTVSVQTPNGLHYWYRYDQTEHGKITIGKNVWPGVDFRCNGGYAVAPGSRTVDGEYTFHDVLNLESHSLADPPDWLLEKLTEDPQESDNQEGGEAHRQTVSVEKCTDKTAEDFQPADGEFVCPLLKKSNKFETDPGRGKLIPPEGKRHQWLQEASLTHFNLGLSRAHLEAIYFDRIHDHINKNAKRYLSAREAKRIFDWAESAERRNLPEYVVEYHRYYSKKKHSHQRQSNSTGRRRWKGTKIASALIKYLHCTDNLQYHTGMDGAEGYELLAEDLHEWAMEHLDKDETVPLRSLKRWVKKMERKGYITLKIQREGTGYVLFSVRLPSIKDASMPDSLTKRSMTRYQGRSPRARDADPEPSEPNTRGDPPKSTIPAEMIENSTLTTPYPGLNGQLDNVQRTGSAPGRSNMPDLPPGRRRPFHILAWITDDPDFASWVYRHVTKNSLDQVLEEYVEHRKTIDNPGAWLRSRLRNKFEDLEGI